jgi:hypothetical protein
MERTGLGGQRAPASVAVLLNVGEQLLVLLRRPRPLLEPILLAARRSPHHPCYTMEQHPATTTTMLGSSLHSFPLINGTPADQGD